MKKLLFLFFALFVSFASVQDKAYGWGATGGDGTNYLAIQEVAVFFNNSGATMSAGDVVILDSTGTAGTTLGAYVTKATAADSVLAVGVVKSTSVADQRPVAVVTKGPVDTRCSDSSDAVTTLTAVGTSGIASQPGYCGGGTNLGIALEAGAGTDNDTLMIWVQPTGAD